MLLALVTMCSIAGDTYDKKSHSNPKVSSFWNFLQLQFDIRYGKIVPNYARKNSFMVMTSSMTSQEDLKIVPLYSLINEKWTFCVITEKNNRGIIIILSVCVYHLIVNMHIWIIMDYFTVDIIRAPNKPKLWIAIVPSIFELEHLSKAQNVTNAHGYLYKTFKFCCHFQ